MFVKCNKSQASETLHLPELLNINVDTYNVNFS